MIKGEKLTRKPALKHLQSVESLDQESSEEAEIPEAEPVDEEQKEEEFVPIWSRKDSEKDQKEDKET